MITGHIKAESYRVNEMNLQDAEIRIGELTERLKYHNRKYYVEDAPEIEDFEYDAMLRELENLEKECFQQSKSG